MKYETIWSTILFCCCYFVIMGQSLQKKVASDRNIADNLGYSVSIDGNFAVASAYIKDQPQGNFGYDIGHVYIYQKNSGNQWNEIHNISPTNYTNGDQFGHSVDIYGDYIIVGAPTTQEVTIYNKSNNWSNQTFFPSSSAPNYSSYGYSVAIGSNYAVVGAPSQNSGVVYVYEKSGSSWTFHTSFAPSNSSTLAFGYDVDVSGNRIVVGCNGGEYVYVYEKSGSSWISTTQSNPNPNPNTYTHFGNTVSIHNNTIVVGSYDDDDLNNSLTNSGAAFVYEYKSNQWNLSSTIRPQNNASNNLFGYDVNINASQIIIGSIGNETVYTYQRNGTNWGNERSFSNPSNTTGDKFGISVATNGTNFIVGAAHESLDENDANFKDKAGAIYFSTNTTCGTIVLTTPITTPTGYEEDVIIASNSVQNSALYKAASNVILLPGFSVNQGIYFNSYIGPCNTGLPKPKEPNDHSTIQNISIFEYLSMKDVDNPIITTIFPNPVNTYINIKVSNSNLGKYTLNVTDVLGKVHLTTTNEFNELHKVDVAQIPNGYYFLVLKNTSGSVLKVEPIQIIR